MMCRHCQSKQMVTFLDLGVAPPSNAYLTKEKLNSAEVWYPLRLVVCEICWLVQTEDYVPTQVLFPNDYSYLSSTSLSWCQHAKKYSVDIIKRLNLTKNSFVIEIGANDGYLLKNFIEDKIPCLGIEPTFNTATIAESSGIPILKKFFNKNLASELASNHQKADLIIGNNVYAHVPDINDFTKGLKILLKAGGTFTLEFPHLLQLIKYNQFDTVYHEHFSYFSLSTVMKIFASVHLQIWDVEILSSHGGSLRVFGCHTEDERKQTSAVDKILCEEIKNGLNRLSTYINFKENVDKIKNDLLTFLIHEKQCGRQVIAYGAAAKGNTLLNYAGIKSDLIPYVCDAAISKQGKFLPGSHIPIVCPSLIDKIKPDNILILPWNIAKEIIGQQKHIANWGGSFITVIPELRKMI